MREPASGRTRAFAVMANRAGYWFSRHWLLVFNLLVAIYVGLPFLAPVLMHQGLEKPANLIYKVYSPACHQLGFRSWFLYGEHAYYPLEQAGVEGAVSFEEIVHDDPAYANLTLPADFGSYVWVGRSFVGNELVGYKTALCQRDIAIYLALLAGGMAFGVVRKRLKPIPWQAFAVLGVLPMLIDGGYQLVSWYLGALAAAADLPTWLHEISVALSGVFAPHETIPLWRTVTGTLFGLGLALLTYPHIEAGMVEMKIELHAKLARAGLLRK